MATIRFRPASYNLCLRCHYRVRKPYRYHKACQQAEEDEQRDRILALPEKPITQEIWERMWGQEMSPFERQKGNEAR